MNRGYTKRLEQVTEASKKELLYPVMRCKLSDGSIEDMHILKAFTFNEAELSDTGELIYKEPYITQIECIANAEYAPKLVSLCMQIIGD